MNEWSQEIFHTFLLQWNILFWDNLYSRDTSIYHGTQNLAEACKNVLFVTTIKDTSIQGKGTLFWIQKPGLNLHSEDTVNSSQKVTNHKNCQYKV